MKENALMEYKHNGTQSDSLVVIYRNRQNIFNGSVIK